MHTQRKSPVSLGLLVLLAQVLIAANYHFVSDVLAGAYAGLLVEAGTCRVVERTYRFLPMAEG